MSDLAEIKAELAELGAIIKRERRKKRKDKRPNINLRLEFEEAAILNAACTERGMCRSDLIRTALNTMLGTSFATNRETPPELRRWINRHKNPSEVTRNLKQRSELIAAGSARYAPIPTAMMTEAPSASPLAKGMLTEPRR